MAERPFCLCIAGPNGSGKSTLAGRLRGGVDPRFWIDPDEMAENLRLLERVPNLTQEMSEEAFRLSRRKRVEFARERADFAFETVFSHGSNLAFLRALKSLGYDIHLYFVCTEQVEINVARVTARTQQGQHWVDPHKIRSRYARSLALLSLAVREADRTFLLDNTQSLAGTGRGLGGRLVAEIWGDDEGTKSEILSLYPMVPTWALRYGVFPFATSWQLSDPCRSAIQIFGDTVHFQIGADRRIDDRVLDQFEM